MKSAGEEWWGDGTDEQKGERAALTQILLRKQIDRLVVVEGAWSIVLFHFPN